MMRKLPAFAMLRIGLLVLLRRLTGSCKVGLILFLGILRAFICEISYASSTPASGFRCESRVYVYLDKSASLSSSDRSQLAEGLGAVLRSSEGPISDYKYVHLRSFAGSLGNREDMPPEMGRDGIQITNKVKEIFRRSEPIGEGQSNLVKVLEDIKSTLDELEKAQVKGSVFIIASDFIHDQTDEEDGLSKRIDWDGWQYAAGDDSALWRALTAAFRNPSDGNVLLILPLEAQLDPLDIGAKVLAKMRSLTLYNGQVTAKGSLDLQGLARFLKPLSIKNTVVRHVGNFYHEALVENHSCVRLPPLRVRLSPGGVNNYDDFEYIADGRFRSKEPIRVPQSSGDPEDRPAADFTVHVQLDGAQTPIDLQSQGINTQEYLFLSELSLRPDEFNDSFEGSAFFSQVYWHQGLRVALKLKSGDKVIGASEDIGFEEISALEPSLVKRQVSLKVGKALPGICYQPHWKDGRLKLEVKVSPDTAGIQSYQLPVYIRNPDGEKDLLEDLAQQGSLPALGALMTMLLMFARRRSVSMGTVEETTAVVGLFWITAFLLMHHIPSFGVLLDLILCGRPASVVGAAICLLLAGFICMLLRKGAIGPSRESAEIALDVEKRALGIPLGADPAGGVWRRFVIFMSRGPAGRHELGFWGVVILAVLILVVGIGLVIDPPEPECALEVAEAISVSN